MMLRDQTCTTLFHSKKIPSEECYLNLSLKRRKKKIHWLRPAPLHSRKPWYIRPPIPLSRQALQGFFTITYYSETIKNFLCAKYKIKIAYFIRCTSIPKHGRERRENRNPDLMHSCCWIAKQSTYLCTNSIKKNPC